MKKKKYSDVGFFKQLFPLNRTLRFYTRMKSYNLCIRKPQQILLKMKQNDINLIGILILMKT